MIYWSSCKQALSTKLTDLGAFKSLLLNCISTGHHKALRVTLQQQNFRT